MEEDQVEDIMDPHNNVEDDQDGDTLENQNNVEDNQNNPDTRNENNLEKDDSFNQENFRVTRSGRKFNTFFFSHTSDLPEALNSNMIITERFPDINDTEDFPKPSQGCKHQ